MKQFNIFLVLFGLAYIIAIVTNSDNKVGFVVHTPHYSPAKYKQSEIPEIPELTAEEKAEADSLHKTFIHKAEIQSERKSVQSMRDDVIKILNEIVEEDSTVTISFNMTTKNPFIWDK